MSCKCASSDLSHICSVTGDRCIFIIPNSKACAEMFGEGPDADQHKCEDCKRFYLENNKRCCLDEPLSCEGDEILPSKYIDKDVLCCGGFKDKNKPPFRVRCIDDDCCGEIVEGRRYIVTKKIDDRYILLGLPDDEYCTCYFERI